MKSFLLSVFRLLYLCGLPAVFRWWHRHSLTIVLYHGVAPSEPHGIYNYRGKFIEPETFEEQLAYFRSHYTVVPLEKSVQHMYDGTLAPNSLAITFDDGYRNFYEYAYPLLKKYSFSATMFVATDFVTRQQPLWVDRLEYAVGRQDGTRAEKIAHDARTRAAFKTIPPAQREHDLRNEEQTSFSQFTDFSGDRSVYAPLTKEQMAAMQLNGISFGAHTQSHPILSTLTEEEQHTEIEGSRTDLMQAGIRVSPIFAYPNGQAGDWNADTERALKVSGFTHALTTLEGGNSALTPPYELKRYVLDATDDFAVFANVVSGVRLFLKSIL